MAHFHIRGLYEGTSASRYDTCETKEAMRERRSDQFQQPSGSIRAGILPQSVMEGKKISGPLPSNPTCPTAADDNLKKPHRGMKTIASGEDPSPARSSPLHLTCSILIWSIGAPIAIPAFRKVEMDLPGPAFIWTTRLRQRPLDSSMCARHGSWSAIEDGKCGWQVYSWSGRNNESLTPASCQN
jgi:hypothetical protein